MFLNHSRIMKNPKILSYVGDMDPMKFHMEDNYNCNDKQLMTTLDHQSTQLSNPQGDVKNKPYPLSSINTTMYIQIDIHQYRY